MEKTNLSPIRGVVVPAPLARAMLARARRLDVGLGGRYVAEGERISVWPQRGSEEADPVGGFRIDLRAPGDGWATVTDFWWDSARSSAQELRTSLRQLAARQGDRGARAGLRRVGSDRAAG